MKIKQYSAISMLLVLSFVISSCAINHEVEKKLLGKWKPVSAENLTPQSAPTEPTQTKVKVDTSTEEGVRKETEVTVAAQRSEKGQKFDRMMATEMNSPVKLYIENNKRLVEKYFSGKTVKGTWKLKKNGKRIAVKVTDTGRKVTWDIMSLTDSTVVVQEKLPFGELKIDYAKVK